jgi:hypothetical protein
LSKLLSDMAMHGQASMTAIMVGGRAAAALIEHGESALDQLKSRVRAWAMRAQNMPPKKAA